MLCGLNSPSFSQSLQQGRAFSRGSQLAHPSRFRLTFASNFRTNLNEFKNLLRRAKVRWGSVIGFKLGRKVVEDCHCYFHVPNLSDTKYLICEARDGETKRFKFAFSYSSHKIRPAFQQKLPSLRCRRRPIERRSSPSLHVYKTHRRRARRYRFGRGRRPT